MNLVAGGGIEPPSGAYETPELPLLYPAIDLKLNPLISTFQQLGHLD